MRLAVDSNDHIDLVESSPPSTRATQRVARRLLRYIDTRPIWGYMVAYVIIILIAYPLQKLVIPYLISSGIVRWSHRQGTTVLANACLYVGLTVAVAWLMWATLYAINLAMQQHITVDVRRRMVRDLIADAKYHTQEQGLGRLLTHIHDMNPNKLFNYMVPECTGILVMTVFFAYVDWRFGLATLAYLFTSAGYFITFIGGSQVRAKAEYDRQVQYNQQVHNTVDNLAYIQSSQSEAFEMARLAKDSDRLLSTKMRFCYRNSAFIAGSNALLIAYALLMLWLVYRHMASPGVSAHTLALSGTVVIVLFSQISDLDYAKYMMTEIYNYTYKSAVFLDDDDVRTLSKRTLSPPTTTTRAQEVFIPVQTSVNTRRDTPAYTLVLHQLAYQHRGARGNVFRKLSHRFEPQTLHAIRGPSGCGKTTLAKLIAGIYAVPSEGAIHVDGQDMTHDPMRRQATIAYVPQHVKLFEGSILDNIRYTCTHLSAKRVRRVLHSFRVDHIFQRHMRDVDYLHRAVGVQGSNMSGGQRQVILLMRTYLEATETRRGTSAVRRRPKTVLIMDEPTASLDPLMVDTVMRILRQMARTHTVCIITHDDRVARHCDSEWSLQDA